MLLDPDEISDIVTQDVTMQCVDAAGQSLVLEATLGYDVQDPYAVTTTFRTDQCEVPWTFARELLTRGLTSPVGEGDVHVWPSRNDSEQDVVVIKLSSLDDLQRGDSAMIHRCAKVPDAPAGDWRSGSALRSHRRGHWFEPSIAHSREEARWVRT